MTGGVTSQGVLYYQTSSERNPDYPDVEVAMSESGIPDSAFQKFLGWKPDIWKIVSKPNSSSFFSLTVTPLHTYSLGTVRLRSTDPYQYPLIDPNVMSDPEGKDMRTTYEGIQFILNLANNTKAFRRINATFAMKPIQYCSKYEFLTKDYWYCAMKYITSHNNHPVSTCRMGPEPKNGDVVDSQLRVYGIKRLRVADASVIPLSTSSHINSICIMIGEKAADFIKKDHNCTC